MFSSRYVCLDLRLPLWLSWRPDESQRSSRKHLWWCENTTQQQCIIPTYYILNNVLDPWCWRNTVSWRFDCDRLTDFRWFTLYSLTSGCRQKFRQEHHIRVKSIQVTRFSASPLKLSPFSLKKTHKNTKKTQLTKLQMIFNVNSSCHNCENPTWCRQKQGHSFYFKSTWSWIREEHLSRILMSKHLDFFIKHQLISLFL